MVNWKRNPSKLAARAPSHTKLTLTSNLIGYLLTGQLPFQTYFPVISSLSTYALSRSLFIITHLARSSQLLSLHPLRLYEPYISYPTLARNVFISSSTQF